jgi:HTH-type transcriptional regulator, competence development regulator
MPETLGDRIRRRRGELNLTLREAAKRLGKSATILSRLEGNKEKTPLKEETIRKLAEVLQDSFDELMLLAGKVPHDVVSAMKNDPGLPEFLRQARKENVSAEQLMDMLPKKGKS